MTREAYTIESLDKRKRELDKRISQCEESISLKWHTLFAPPEVDTKMQRWVNHVERAVAVYDGFMMMYKLAHRFGKIKSLLRKKK